MAGIWPDGLICKTGDAQIVIFNNGTKVDVPVVIKEKYRIFAPMVGVVALGYSDPDIVGNIFGVIPPGGFLDITATATTLMLICKDTTDEYGTDYGASAYLIKLSDNA